MRLLSLLLLLPTLEMILFMQELRHYIHKGPYALYKLSP